MKWLIPTLATILGCSSAAWADASASITPLRAIRALTNAQASHAPPVAFEATVTFFRAQQPMLYVQDGDAGIYVLLTKDVRLVPGDRILVHGIMRPSYLPIVESKDVTLLHHGNLPAAKPASYPELVSQQYICQLVKVRATVRSRDLIYSGDVRGNYLHLITSDGAIEASVLSNDGIGLQDLLDAEVEVTGVAGTLLDSKMQKTGIILHTMSMADVKVLKLAANSPWTLPVTQMDAIFAGYRARDITARVRVQGTITYYQPGAAIVLQNGSKSLWISTQTNDHLQIGAVVDATGFPDFHEGFLSLVRGEFRDSHMRAPVTPMQESWQSLALSDNIHLGHIYDLVSTEGKLVTEARESARDEYVLSANGHLFTAIYRHSDKASLIPLPQMKQIPIGATVRVTGICVQLSSSPFNGEIPFDILLRTFDDIEVVSRPSPLNIRNLVLVIGLLLAVVIAVGFRSLALERKVRRQTAALAYLERRRSQILENISGSLPLAEIIEQITAMVSLKLRGAPCWCRILDGARVGNLPPNLTGLRVVREKIHDHSGAPLGEILAAVPSLARPAPDESEALSMGAALATLAVETRRLYSDLLHRSEFDLLTDIHNRFSLEKRLNALIHESSQAAGIFGLIYIDLDEFKQVNDVCGHLAGDLYLQDASTRMKRQLRPGDMLARLGGDEFAVLVPVVRSRADVEEIALRLERSFDDAFAIEGYVLHGSASVGIALYPEDGLTGDFLLGAADAAMYQAKDIKRRIRQGPDNHPTSTLEIEIGA